jgi:hypothetical protein
MIADLKRISHVLRLCGDHELTAGNKTISKVLKLCCANDLIVDHRTICEVLKLTGAHHLTADDRTISDEHITLSTKTCTHFVKLQFTLGYRKLRENLRCTQDNADILTAQA